VRSTPQMAKNGKNRLAILTIFRFRRTDVKGGLQFFTANNKHRANGGENLTVAASF
jgi:hypothetical protein